MLPYLSPDGKTLILSGEMELPIPSRIEDAYRHMANIAEECGYLVGSTGRGSLHVTGGDIPGYVELDWSDVSSPGPTSVSVWTAATLYLDDGKLLSPGEYLAQAYDNARNGGTP